MNKSAEAVIGKPCLLQGREQPLWWFGKRLKGELECPPMHRDCIPRFKVTKNLHSLFRCAMRFAHEVTRRVGTDRDRGKVGTQT